MKPSNHPPIPENTPPKFLLLLIITCIFQSIQAKSKFTNEQKDSISLTYKMSYSHLLGVYAYGINKSSSFEFSDPSKDNVIRYQPNTNFNLGLGFNYKWMGIGGALNFGFINNDDDKYGETKSLDLQADLFPKGWLINANFQYYQGYYWSNPDDFEDQFTIDPNLIRSDITTLSLGITGVYAINRRKFSYKAPFAYTEKQKKSAGSILVGGTMAAYGIFSSDSTSLLPETINADYPGTRKITTLSSGLIGLIGGYSYTVVIHKNWYINGTLLLGINHQNVETRTIDDEIDHISKSSASASLRASLGYDNQKSYFGMSLYSTSFLLNTNTEMDFFYDFSRFRIVYGRRFNISKLGKNRN